MLIAPDSSTCRHRNAWTNAGGPQEARRLAQARAPLGPAADGGADPSGASAWGCGTCGIGFGVDLPAYLVEEVTALRPAAAVAIDQCHLDAASLHRRVAAMSALRPMRSSRAAFVGDDDLASVALLRADPPQHLLLIDVDERVLAVVADQARELRLADRVEVVHLNLADTAALAELLERVGESFDVVVTDPPYAHDGMRTFVAAATHLACYGGELHLAVPAMLAEAWTDELLLSVQSDLIASGFVIDRSIPGAFTYETSDVVSSLVIARRIPGSVLTGDPHPPGLARFYTTRTSPAHLDGGVYPPDRSIGRSDQP